MEEEDGEKEMEKKKKKTKKNSTKESEWASDEFLSDDVILFPFKANQVMGDILIYLIELNLLETNVIYSCDAKVKFLDDRSNLWMQCMNIHVGPQWICWRKQIFNVHNFCQ